MIRLYAYKYDQIYVFMTNMTAMTPMLLSLFLVSIKKKKRSVLKVILEIKCQRLNSAD